MTKVQIPNVPVIAAVDPRSRMTRAYPNAEAVAAFVRCHVAGKVSGNGWYGRVGPHGGAIRKAGTGEVIAHVAYNGTLWDATDSVEAEVAP